MSLRSKGHSSTTVIAHGCSCALQGEISCLDVENLPTGRTRARFCAVGGYDNTVRVLSLAPNDMFQQVRKPMRAHADRNANHVFSCRSLCKRLVRRQRALRC